MQWYLRAEMTGTPSQDQQEILLAAGAFSIQTNLDTDTTVVQLTIDAADHAAALGEAKRTLERFDALTEFIDSDVLTVPYRVIVEEPGAPHPDSQLMGTEAFAKVLEVSPRRIGQMAGQPGFPT